MKVAYFTGRYPSISHTFILREASALRARGVDVVPFAVWRSAPEELLTSPDRNEAKRTYALLPPRPWDWVRAHVRALRTSRRAYAASLLRARRLSQPTPRGIAMGLLWFGEAMVLWDRCRRIGLEHIHAHLNGTAPAVALVAASYGRCAGSGPASWSLTVHGPTEFYDVERERLEEKVRSATFVVCISDFARSQLMGLVEESHWEKLKIVHCGVDPAAFPMERARDNGAARGPVRLLSVGRLVQVMGQAVLLRALRELSDRGIAFEATIVGDGPKRADLVRLASELDIQDQVEFMGAIGQDRIRWYYANSDIFCLSSFAEGVPVVLMEAMATGLPVVAPAVMGVAELVEDGVSGSLIRPGRADLLADAVQRLAEDPAARVALGEQGRRKIVEEFDIGASADALLDLYSSHAN